MSQKPHQPTYSPVLLDGAWGTELQTLGLKPGDCPDAWNLTHPEHVASVATAYVNSGSEVILTNTFGANRIALERYGLSDRVTEINRAAVAISAQSANGKAQVYASIGPSGKLLTIGDVTRAELMLAFDEQAAALAEGGAAALVLETFTDVEELQIALGAAKKTGLNVIACMVFDSGKGGDRTAMGITLERATTMLTNDGADAIGANCGRGVENYVPLCRRLRELTDRPLWFKPNAGLPKLIDGQVTYDIAPQQFAAGIVELLNAGAHWVGGCCGSNPSFIRAIAQVLNQRSQGST